MEIQVRTGTHCEKFIADLKKLAELSDKCIIAQCRIYTDALKALADASFTPIEYDLCSIQIPDDAAVNDSLLWVLVNKYGGQIISPESGRE